MIEKIIPLVKERMKTLKEFESLAGFFFEIPSDYEKSVEQNICKELKHALTDCEWNHDSMEQAVRGVVEKLGEKARPIFMQLRIAITGKKVGPPLLESMELLGKKESLQRLEISNEYKN
ncbi:hypothetical protein ACFL1P_00940 [Patescibacteria group bacterium]